MTVNGLLPAPLLRLREGQNARFSVTNTLDEDTSIHWHGVLLPFQMDGVPGISFVSSPTRVCAGIHFGGVLCVSVLVPLRLAY